MEGEARSLNVLVVDDEPDLANVIRYNLTRRGHQVSTADSGESALAHVHAAGIPDLVISDVMMPVMDGFELCRQLRAATATAEIPLFFLTARATPADKEEGFRAGCDDYLAKPFDMNELMLRVEALGHRLERARLAAGRLASQPAPELKSPSRLMEKLAAYEKRFPALRQVRTQSLLGHSSQMVDMFEELLIQAHTRDPVLITGETGTGKTLVAEALWQLGPRSAGPFRTINCAELQAADPLVVMGRLFGFGRNSGLQHVPKEGQPGILEEVNTGTLFLDEVALLPPQAQALLLLPTEGRPFNPAAGRGDPVTVDVKLIFATNRDLNAEAQAGRFPLDLLMRVGQSVIRMAPLRERPGDALLLARHFIAEAATELDAGHMQPGADLMAEVERRSWPGNVRELRATLRDAVRRAHFRDAPAVGVEHLGTSSLAVFSSYSAPRVTSPSAPALGMGAAPNHPSPLVAPAATGAHAVDFTGSELSELEVLRRYRFQIAPSEAELGLSQKSRTLTNHLRGMCFKALARTGFDVGEAAAAVAGPADEALLERMQARIHHYLSTVRENVAQTTEERLFNNLPRDYHRAMEEAVQRARAGTLPAAPGGPSQPVED